MQKFIPREKLSKKAKRVLDRSRRQTWAINPVSRKSESPKAYNRKKAQRMPDDDGGAGLLYFPLIPNTAAAYKTPRRVWNFAGKEAAKG